MKPKKRRPIFSKKWLKKFQQDPMSILSRKEREELRKELDELARVHRRAADSAVTTPLP